jgi:hypothetical protein
VAGDLSESQEGFTTAQMQQARQQLTARLGENFTMVKQRIGSGEEGLTITTNVELPSGGFLTTRILAVPLGDRGLILVRMAPAEHDDETEWVALVASLHSTSGLPWLWIGGGVAGLFLLVLGIRSGGRAPTVSSGPTRDLGARFTPPPWQQDGAIAPGASMPGAGANTALRGSSVPKPPAPEAAGAAGGPGLKSTLPASGRWGHG